MINNLFDFFLTKIDHIGNIGYIMVFLFAAVESIPFVGVLLPGAILIAFFGFLASQNYFDTLDLVWYSIVGAILGDLFSYFLGTKGTKFFKDENKILKLGHLEKGKDFFNCYGDKSVFFGRFVGPIRGVISFVAGLYGMKFRKFIFLNIASAIPWAFFYVFLGYFFGDFLNKYRIWTTRIGLFVLFIIIFFLLGRIVFKRVKIFNGK